MRSIQINNKHNQVVGKLYFSRTGKLHPDSWLKPEKLDLCDQCKYADFSYSCPVDIKRDADDDIVNCDAYDPDYSDEQGEVKNGIN